MRTQIQHYFGDWYKAITKSMKFLKQVNITPYDIVLENKAESKGKTSFLVFIKIHINFQENTTSTVLMSFCHNVYNWY